MILIRFLMYEVWWLKEIMEMFSVNVCATFNFLTVLQVLCNSLEGWIWLPWILLIISVCFPNKSICTPCYVILCCYCCLSVLLFVFYFLLVAIGAIFSATDSVCTLQVWNVLQSFHEVLDRIINLLQLNCISSKAGAQSGWDTSTL